MSVERLSPTIAKLEALKVPYKVELSPYTGQLAVYAQYIAPTSISQAGGIANLNAWRNVLTSEFGSRGYDAYCNDVSYVQGIISDTYYSSIWGAVEVASSGNLVLLGVDGLPVSSLLAPILLFQALWEIFVVHWAATAALIAISVIAVAVIWILVFPYQDQYTTADPGGALTTGSWTEQMSRMNALYWYVCPKDLYAVGPKSVYASPSDVPADQVALFNDHCAKAADISPDGGKLPDWIWWIIIPAVAIGGIYIAAKVLPSFLRRKTPQKREVE